ncbi:MAG: type IV toxin-antitoxin system AbiEi family antitoxin domain-containing protein [Mycobacterium sp.]
MNPEAQRLLDELGGLATTRQLLRVLTRDQLAWQVRRGEIVRVVHGVYASRAPDTAARLSALDVFLGQEAVACLGTAAALYGFDTEATSAIHVLDPAIRLRPKVGLMVHQRYGAPLMRVAGRLATSPAWTAVEVARQVSRPRALATLDAALHSGWCTTAELDQAVKEQHGRRGIVNVRALVEHADGRAESGMESEARLVMIDHDVPTPELQYEIIGRDGTTYRVDFAWPDHRVAAEYESIDWHAGRMEMLRDKRRFAAVQEANWLVIPIVTTDVRDQPARLAARLNHHLARASRQKLG